MNVCSVKYCRNKCKGIKCNTCRDREKRERNPMRYAYDNLKHNTYRRKGRHFFELTFEEFKRFAIETNYIQGKGRSRTSYSIDRIDNTMGYFIGNIRILTVGQNAKKHTKSLVYDWEHKYATVNTHGPAEKDIDLPF